ncbi:MAG: glycoside hydrolase family 95-like protein, partial [Tannerellaceae bacterium]
NCFCLRNTFHVNGDQSKSGKSNFTYRPFTLEGNFAFASGVQDMLLQSHTDTIKIFPAVPASWNNISFRDLRAQRGVLVSAQKENGKIKSVTFKSDHGTPFFVKDPFGAGAAFMVKSPNKDAAISTAQPGIVKIELKPGEELILAAE